MHHRELKLFAPNAGRAYGEAVSRALGQPLAAHEEREFEDGEHKARSLENVRDCDVFVVQSLYGDAQRSADDKLLRLLFLVGALKDASAARVTVVAPYLAYSRKDQKSKARDPVTTRYVATLFEAVGADCMVTLDVHNLAAYQNAFRCRAEHLEAGPLFVRTLAPRLRDADVAVVSPDAGGIKRADAFRTRLAAALGRPVGMAFAEKYRSGGELRGDALRRRRRRQGGRRHRRPDQRRQHDRARRACVPRTRRGHASSPARRTACSRTTPTRCWPTRRSTRSS